MADEDPTGGEGGEGGEGKDPFDPKTLSPEAQEFIRKSIQSESDSKAAYAEKKLRDEAATKARKNTEVAELDEINKLAEAGDLAGIGARVVAQTQSRTARDNAIFEASDIIERQMAEKFSESLGPEQVEQIRRKVVEDGGAHAEFAAALAKAEGGKTRTEEIQAEVKAQLLAAGVNVRDETSGADKVAPAGQGAKLSGLAEREQAVIDGKVAVKAFVAAEEASGKG